MDHFEGNRNLRLSSDSLLSAVHSPAIDLATRQSNYLVKQENSVHIPWRTLLDFGQNSLVRFALIIYKQIDQFIQPNYELFSSIQNGMAAAAAGAQQLPAKLQINSDLVGLLLTNEPFLQIPGTVFITFKHKQNLTTAANSAQLHPQTQYCALWNFGLKQWQTDGCQLIESNRTHSTCECNHLSVYALLKSVLAEDEQKSRDPTNPSLVNTANERAQDSAGLENLLTIGGYQWAFYTNQLKALVASSCYLSILCLAFVLVSLAFVQYREAKTNRLLHKKSGSINGTLTDLSLNIHYGTYHSSNNSLTYGSTTAAANKPSTNSTACHAKRSAGQSTFCSHQNLCFVLVLIELLLVFSSKSLPTKLDYENRLNCAIFAALLHYLLLSLFVWLLFDVLILHSSVKHHLNQLNLLKSTTDYTLPTISSLTGPNHLSAGLSMAPKSSAISNKWLIAVAYGSCSLLLLVSVLLDAQSYGAALSSGHCFLSNAGPSYLYLLVLPIFVLIICITISSLSTIKSMAKTRYPLSLNPIKNGGAGGDLNSSSASIVLGGNLFATNSLLCKQLKESIVTVIIVSLTWSAGLIYLNAAEKVTANSTIGSRSYQLFGILFSALNIAQAAFFVLYYCLLDSTVRKSYYLLFVQFKRSLNLSFSGLASSFRRKDKVVAASLSANTINTTISNAPSLLTGCTPNAHKQQLNGDLVKAANQMIEQLNSVGQQPIIPPPTTISGSNQTHHTMKPANFYLNNNGNSSATMAAGQKLSDEPEKCSIDYGFPAAVALMNSNNLNRSAFHRTTSALHSYQIANSANLNCSQANAYVSKSAMQDAIGQQSNGIVEHVYESIDGENPYIAKLLSNYQTLGSHHHFLNHHHQLSHLHKTLRPVSSVVHQQQLSNIYHQQPIASMNGSHGHLRSLSDLSNISERPLLSTKATGGHSTVLAAAGAGLPAIIRDNTKSSTILPNSFQQQHKMKKFSNGTLNGDHHHHFNHHSNLNAQQLSAQQLLKESTLI